jgi:hypothetical protein
MNTFKQDCLDTIKELQSVVKVLEKQEKINNTLDKMNLNPEQKEILAKLFLDEEEKFMNISEPKMKKWCCPCGCISDIEQEEGQEYIIFCEQCGDELIKQEE